MSIGSVTLATNATSSTSGNYNANTGGNPASWTITASAATGGTFNANNYTITYDTGTQTITPAALTVSGMTASNKTYDSTTAATLNNGSDSLGGVVAGHNNGGGTADAVTLGTGSASGTFASANVANGITVNTSGFTISGADSGNYTLTNPSTTANITPATLTIASGVTANNKTYDGTTTATFTESSPVFTGLFGSDSVNLNSASASGTFAGKNVANGISVTASGFALSGAQASDYALTQPTGLTANITPATLTVTADNQSMTVGGTVPTLTSTIAGFVGGETLTNSGVAGAASPTTTATGSSPAGNYTITEGLGSLAANNYSFTLVNGTLADNAPAASGGGRGGWFPPVLTPVVPPQTPVTVVTPVTPEPVPVSAFAALPATVGAISAAPPLIYGDSANDKGGTPLVNPVQKAAMQVAEASNVSMQSIWDVALLGLAQTQVRQLNTGTQAPRTQTPTSSIKPLYDPMYDNPDEDRFHITGRPARIGVLEYYGPADNTIMQHYDPANDALLDDNRSNIYQGTPTEWPERVAATSRPVNWYEIADNSKSFPAISALEQDNNISMVYDPANDNSDGNALSPTHDNNPNAKDKKKVRRTQNTRDKIRDRLQRIGRFMRGRTGSDEMSSRFVPRPDNG